MSVLDKLIIVMQGEAGKKGYNWLLNKQNTAWW